MPSHSNWRTVAEAITIPIAALLVAFLLFGCICALLTQNLQMVYSVLSVIYKAAFGSWFSCQNTLIRAAPLMLTALCTALPARLGLMVIGNEGALVMGGIGAIGSGLLLAYGTLTPSVEQLTQVVGLAPLVGQVVMAFSGMVAGGLWIMAVGALRHYRAVNETISSLLMNYIAIALMNHLVGGPIKDPSSLNRPSSFALPDAFMMGMLPSSRVHYGLLYGIVACLLAYSLLQKTTIGFAVRTVGGNVKAAKMAGLPVGRLTLMICFLAGSCAGLAGMVEVAAVHGRLNESIVAGYGYTGILVAFVARHNPIAATLVAILLGGILASGGALQRNLGLPDAAVLFLQGLVFLVILYSESLYGRFKLFQNPVAD